MVFSTVFKDDDDVIIGKVFMQVRRKSDVTKFQSCPPSALNSPVMPVCVVKRYLFVGIQRGATSQPHRPAGVVQPQGAPAGAEGHGRRCRGQHRIHHLWWDPVIFVLLLFNLYIFVVNLHADVSCFQSCSLVTPMPMPETTPSTSFTPSGTTCITT